MSAEKVTFETEHSLIQYVEDRMPENVEKFRNEDLARPGSYPCVGVISEDRGWFDFFICMRDLVNIKLESLEVSETGIVIIKVPNIGSARPHHLEGLQKALEKLGLSGLLMQKGDEIMELSHQQLVNIADSLGYEVKAKGRA